MIFDAAVTSIKHESGGYAVMEDIDEICTCEICWEKGWHIKENETTIPQNGKPNPHLLR